MRSRGRECLDDTRGAIKMGLFEAIFTVTTLTAWEKWREDMGWEFDGNLFIGFVQLL